MNVIRTESDIAGLEDTELQDLIRQRIAETADYVDHFSELVHFVVVRPGDHVATVDDALGFPVLVNRFDGVPFGHADFTPSWDALQEHAGWFELVYVTGDDGSGVTVFVSKTDGVSPELLSMCRRFTPLEVHP
jgi:hypothetical protein